MKNFKESALTIIATVTVFLGFNAALIFGGYATPDAATQAPQPAITTHTEQMHDGPLTFVDDVHAGHTTITVKYYRAAGHTWNRIKGGYNHEAFDSGMGYGLYPDEGQEHGKVLAVWYVYNTKGAEIARGSKTFHFGR